MKVGDRLLVTFEADVRNVQERTTEILTVGKPASGASFGLSLPTDWLEGHSTVAGRAYDPMVGDLVYVGTGWTAFTIKALSNEGGKAMLADRQGALRQEKVSDLQLIVRPGEVYEP